MQEEIKKYFEAANAIVISAMYLKDFNDDISSADLKTNNSGHLGTSMSMNFILANLYYFLNNHNLNSQLVIGTGHAGVSLLTNLWLNGTLEKYNPKYQRNREGLNNVINDFGVSIRSEINPEYPETIYDGGELGYSLGVAYGYALKSKADIVPCIIGDGEAETGTLMSSWQLAKTLKTESKVLPIINLNGLKMGSKSYLSKLSNQELINYFTALGYTPYIVDSVNSELSQTIEEMQNALNKAINTTNPLIIFKSLKGFTLDGLEGTINVHKNPLQGMNEKDKLLLIKRIISRYDLNIFDTDNNLLPLFDNFKTSTSDNTCQEITIKDLPNSLDADNHLANILNENNGLVFSPDEIYSNKFPQCGNIAIEILNENLLQAIYQGYIQAGNFGYYISYESFMPIISSMITQYYKYLKQKSLTPNQKEKNSLNYLLTSTCWENTYSHQNPDFVNALFEKNDEFYNILYPKDSSNLKKCFEKLSKTKDKINVLTISKRHQKIYQSLDEANTDIETIIDCQSPNLILCATGDYMLDLVLSIYQNIKEENPNIKVIYITKPQILTTNNKDSLSQEEFISYFNENVPSIYLYCGYANTIKALLYDRFIDCEVFGYNDGISVYGNLENNLLNNELNLDNLIQKCQNKLNNNAKTLKLRRKNNG